MTNTKTAKQKGKDFERNCKNCNIKFKTLPSYVKRGGGKYCSKKCSSIFTNLILVESGKKTRFKKSNIKKIKIKRLTPQKKQKIKVKIIKKCLHCKQDIIGLRRKFCEKKICQRHRQNLNTQRMNKKISKQDKKDYYTKWRRKQGIMPRGKSQAEEIIYKKLVEKFGKNEVKRNVWSIVKSPKTGAFLELDFYLKNYKLAFEVDGQTHRNPVYGQDRLSYQLENDKIKEDECKKLGIMLVRIPFGKDIGIYGKFGVINASDLLKVLENAL